MSFDRLIARIDELHCPIVAGLDPRLEYVPSYIVEESFEKHGQTLKGAAKAIYKFNKGLIDALCEHVPAVKPQSAYYEMLGYEGVKALYKTIKYAKKRGMFVILDGKRNDIGSTMEAYASAYLGETQVGSEVYEPFGADALTVSAYLGSDGVKPALELCRKNDKGIFILVKTSNPSSGELQDREIDGAPVYRQMGDMCRVWGAQGIGAYGYSDVGAVVGATYPAQLDQLRKALPETFFLVPGYGAQGGQAEDVALAFDENGRGAIVNSSRAIMCAYKKEGCDERDYAQAALREALRMKQELNKYIK